MHRLIIQLKCLLQSNFLNFILIANPVNEGVAKASNHAIEVSKGEYILLVNPDIICNKDTLEKVVEFMDIHNDASGLGVRMLGPQGSFLPESNRGLTSQWVKLLLN